MSLALFDPTAFMAEHGTPVVVGNFYEKAESESIVATEATLATELEGIEKLDVFCHDLATVVATLATKSANTPEDHHEVMAFVDYVLQDCPDGPVMNPTDEELAESLRGSELFAKLGAHATPEQIQGLAALLHDAKLLKIERLG